jgi:hypothetical protein
MATVGENRVLRDQYNLLLRELRALSEQYNRDRPSIGQNPARDIATFRDIDVKTNSVLFRMEQLQAQNSRNPDLFDPQLAQNIESNVQSGREIITASQQVVRRAEQQQQQQIQANANAAQGSGTVSTGQTTAQAQAANDNGASTQNPQSSPESISASGSVNPTPPTSLPSNADPSQDPVAQALPAPSKLPGGVVAQSNGTVTDVDTSQTPRPALQVSSNNLVTPDENTNLVSYVYRAVAVTSVFRQGKFTQEIDGAQIFFNLPPRQQNNVDLGRQTPTQQSGVAAAAGQSNVRNAASPNTTVGALAATPGVQASNQPGVVTSGDNSQRPSGLTSVLDSRNGSASTTSPLGSDAAGGFEVPGDPYSALVTTSLNTAPPTTGSAGSSTNVAPLPLNPAAATVSSSLTQETQAEISALEQQVFTLNKAVENVNQRIARNEGNAQDNQAMLSFYQTNLRRDQARLVVLRQQLLSSTIDLDVSKPTTVVQQGAKEY